MNGNRANYGSIADYRVILIGIGLAGLWWVIESSIHVFVFQETVKQVLNPDEHEMWMRSLVAVLLIMFGTYAQRITSSRRQAVEALRESEAKYSKLAYSITDIFFAMDRDLKYTFWNKASEKLTGISENEALGRSLYDLFPEVKGSKAEEAYLEVLKTQQSRSIVNEYQLGGKKFIFEINTYPSMDGLSVIVKDITERKQQEAELVRARDEWERTFNAVPDLVIILDSEHRILRSNKAMADKLGRTPEELVGLTCYEVVHGTEEPPDFCPHTRLLADGLEHTIEVYKDRLGGYFAVSVSPIRGLDGKLIGGVHVARDITERRRAEEELKRTRQQLRNLSTYLQSAREQERTSIAREIHDDLGQALTALKMDLHWLSNKLPRDQELLLNKTKSMSSLIDMTIQSVQRISSELRPGLLDDLGLSAAIEWQADEFERRTAIKCNVYVDPEDIILARERSTSIFRIFQESLTNIARHANATMVDISLKEEYPTVELKVHDTGKGITKEQILDPRSFGLIGMHERVYSLGGYLSITGTPNEGTTVMVTIPLNEEE